MDGTTSAVTVVGMLEEAGPALTSGVGLVWDLATGNPLLTFFLGCTIVGFGFTMFRKAKKATR